MSNTTLSAAPSTDTWAEVRARENVTRYRRSGAGQAVLLLDRTGNSSLWPELLHVLGGNFRVISPEIPAGYSNHATWIPEFLEGLGAASVIVVAASDFVVPALDLALRDVHEVTRLVLVPDGESEEPATAGAVTTSAGPAAVPLLVVRRGVPADEALPIITKFLSGAPIDG
jgi:hypothetical protein